MRCGLHHCGLLLWAFGCAPDHPAPDPRLAQTEVRAFRSTDGGNTWALDPEPLARGLDSLGLSIRPDGAWWLSGLDHSEEPPWWEWYTGPRVRGLEWTPGGTWQRRVWWPDVGDTRSVIDPQFFGEELWFASRTAGTSGDPADVDETVKLRVAPGGRAIYEARGLADPSPVEFQGQRHVFLTQLGQGVVHLVGDPPVQTRNWAGYTVPFATVIDDQIWLLAQILQNGRRYPVVNKSADGRTWTGWQPIVPLLPQGPNTCTSPVLGASADTLILLCVDERVSTGHGAPPPERSGRPPPSSERR